ncbi:MAG: LysR family transcriptional regulator [Planctomycetota bacterium]|nr:LysR family transcriptional regulator [Planctomycetota bacterium]
MQSLRLFLDVAKYQSFSRGAAEHGITQSAASQRIRALEKKLGVTLFDRKVRPLAMTPAGEVFAREGRELLDRYDALEQRVSSLRPGVAGQVVVDAIYSAGIDLLDHLRQEFEALHPRVSVVVNYKQPEEVFEAVRREQCDFGIVSFPQQWREGGFIPLRDERMAVVCSPEHPWAHRRRLNASDLHGQRMIAYEPNLPVARRIKKYFRDLGVAPLVASVFDNIDTIKSAVAVTDQVAILPKRTAAREAAAETLVVIDLEPKLVRSVGVIHRRRKTGVTGVFSPAAQAFVDYLREHAGADVDSADALDRTLAGSQLVGGQS